MSELTLPIAGIENDEIRTSFELIQAHGVPETIIAGSGLARTGDTLAIDTSVIAMLAMGWLDVKNVYGTNLAAINNAIAAFNAGTVTLAGNSYSVDVLYFAPATYTVTGTTTVIARNDGTIIGSGPATKFVGSSSNTGRFFTLGIAATPAGAEGTACSRMTLRDFTVSCTNSPTSNAFGLIKGGTITVANIGCLGIGGLATVGTSTQDGVNVGDAKYSDRTQLYSFHNIYGSWDAARSAPSRIHIINGTDGFFESVRLTSDEVNGGYCVHADPTPRGVDQHRFDACELWGEGAHSENAGHGTTYDGLDWNVYLDFSTGGIINWVFNQCVFDEGVTGGAYLVSSGGTNFCKSVHFQDCHFATAGGNGVRVNHGGTGTCTDIQVNGGRIRVKADPAVKVVGADVDSVTLNGPTLVQEQIGYSGANTTRDSIQHTFKHGRAVDDIVVFSGAPPAPLVAGTLYYVKNADANSDGLEFTLSATTPAAGGATIDITTNVAGQYRVRTASLLQLTDAQGVGANGCYFGPFEGGTSTQVLYACQGTGGAEDLYNISGNRAVGMVTGFSTGLTNDTVAPIRSVVANNVSDV